MTEPKIAELYTGIHAHRDALVRAAGDASLSAKQLREISQRMRRGYNLGEAIAGVDAVATDVERLAMELAAGLERLSRLADNGMEDTAVLGLQEVADAEDT